MPAPTLLAQASCAGRPTEAATTLFRAEGESAATSPPDLPRVTSGKIHSLCKLLGPASVYMSVDSSEELLGLTLASVADLATPRGQAEGIRAEEFDGIVRLHQKRIFRLLYGMLRERDTAETLTQECFLRAYRKRHTFRGEASLGTWLARIAVNLARDHARNRRLAFWKRLFPRVEAETQQRQLAELSDPGPSPERALLAREQLELVWSLLDQLPAQQRSAFLLRFAEEMTLEEIAQVMKLEIGTVKAHLFRAVGAIRRKLQEQRTP